jgi:hypothetical protein
MFETALTETVKGEDPVGRNEDFASFACLVILIITKRTELKGTTHLCPSLVSSTILVLHMCAQLSPVISSKIQTKDNLTSLEFTQCRS